MPVVHLLISLCPVDGWTKTTRIKLAATVLGLGDDANTNRFIVGSL